MCDVNVATCIIVYFSRVYTRFNTFSNDLATVVVLVDVAKMMLVFIIIILYTDRSDIQYSVVLLKSLQVVEGVFGQQKDIFSSQRYLPTQLMMLVLLIPLIKPSQNDGIQFLCGPD